jgi:hypothetical protein
MQKNKNILSSLFFFLTLFIFCTNVLGVNLEEHKYGLNVYKKGNCMGCHSWHGKGGGHGAAVSLRNTELTLNEIINVIKCGRPGTGMPYFLRKAYKEEKCYDTTFEDYDETNRPVFSQKFLSLKQIEAVSIFVSEVLQNKKLDKNYCEYFYEKGSKSCLNLNN